jgi:hypothetical protein
LDKRDFPVLLSTLTNQARFGVIAAAKTGSARCFAVCLTLAAHAGIVQAAEAGMQEPVILKGEVLGKGAPCVQFRAQNGETVSLHGASPQMFKKGMNLRLSGSWMRVSNCMQGRAFRVTAHSKL